MNLFYNFLFILFIENIFSKILFTNIHFRHGARSSVMKIDKQGYDFLGKKWENVGELTPLGIRQLYLNGIKHRERYQNFLSEEYNSKEILIYSTKVNRTIQSGNCYLSGLFSNIKPPKIKLEQEIKSFPPGNITEKMKEISQKLNYYAIPEGIQTIPIKNFDKSEHFFLLHDLSYISGCITIDEVQEKHIKSNKTNNLINEFKNNFGNKIKKIFKDIKHKEFIFDFYYINTFCDHLISNILESADLSILEKYNLNINELNNFCQNIAQYNLEEIECGNKDIIFMSLSPTMKQLLLWMDNRIKLDKEGKTDQLVGGSPKFTIWSAHDSSLAANEMFFKYVFGTKFIIPVFGSTVIIELHKNETNKNNSYYIQYFVNDELLLEIDYNIFKENILKYLWNEKEINTFCKFEDISEYKFTLNNYRICLFCTLTLLLISIYINCKLYFKLKIVNKNNNTNNNNEYELKEYLNK